MKLKKSFTLLFVGSIFLSLGILKSQPKIDLDSGFPLKQFNSPLFGKDIVINNNSGQDQRSVTICSAYNGWLYAAYSYCNSNEAYVSLLKSVDNGITWDSVMEGPITTDPNKIVTRLVLMACGNISANFKLFFGWVFCDTVEHFSVARLYRFNPEPFYVEQLMVNKSSWRKQDLAIASDYLFPANNSNPYTIGVLNSTGDLYKDSIIFYSSSNGGMSIDKSVLVALSAQKFHQVALSYGRSASQSSGRYFAAWEEQIAWNSNIGHIYTAHSEPNFNSPFTKPICLDSLNVSFINNVRRPVISCQSNNTDNDSSNMSEIVLFETFSPSASNYDFRGYSNVQAASSKYFKEFNVVSPSNIKLQPDIIFNPYNSTFLLTYFDPGLHKLTYLTKDFNLTDPNIWNVVNPGYNDSTNISLPNPKIAFNPSLSNAICTWVANREGGYGEALFDAPYSTYTGSRINNTSGDETRLSVYPNPCSNTLVFNFNLAKSGEVIITLNNILGKCTKRISDQNFSPGKHSLTIDVSDIDAGTYLYFMKCEKVIKSGKIIITP